MTPTRGDLYIAYSNARFVERLFITVTRVARDRSWVDIRVSNWACS